MFPIYSLLAASSHQKNPQLIGYHLVSKTEISPDVTTFCCSFPLSYKMNVQSPEATDKSQELNQRSTLPASVSIPEPILSQLSREESQEQNAVSMYSGTSINGHSQ